MANTTVQTILWSLTRIALLGVILAGAAVDSVPWDIEVLVVLLAAEAMVVFQNRISMIRVGPLKLNLGRGAVDVDVNKRSVKTASNDADADADGGAGTGEESTNENTHAEKR